MRYTLGVDLGTTWTAGAAFSAEGVSPVEAGEHGPALPSVVARDGEAVVVGEAAERRLEVDPAGGVREPKRRLGDETPFVLGGTPYGAEALLGHLLGHVVSRATEAHGDPPESVVLTHPATWGEYKLDLLREAARVAGVADDRVSLVSEPQAAAWHYASLGRMAVGDVVAVYDFGGGTFDAAVVRRTDDGFEVLGQPKGLERLGGVDLDQAVFAHVEAALGGRLRELDTTDPAVRAGLLRLRSACTSAKEALSADSEAAVEVAVPGISTQVRITRQELEAMVRPRLAETIVALQAALASAGVEADAVSAVLLVGGSSRIPVVAEVVGRETGLTVSVDVDAEMAVALGGAAYGQEGPPAAVDEAAADQPDEADAAKASTADRAGEKAARGDDSRRRMAARTAVGGAVVAGVVGGGAAAAGALGDDPRRPGPEPAPPPVEGPPVDPLGAATVPAEGDSLDAFDDVAAASGDGRGGGGGGGPMRRPASRPEASTGGNGDGRVERSAPAAPEAGTPAGSPMPPPAGSPAPASAETGPPPGSAPTASEAQLEAIRDQLRARVAAFQGPEKADAEDVQALKADLGGLIDRFQPLPGQSVQDAYGALEHEMSQTIDIFVTSERAEIEREAKVEQKAELDADRKVWDTYRDALDRYVDSFVPSAPEHWWSPAELAQVKETIKTQIIDRRPYVPQEGKTMRAAQEDIERTVDMALDQFRQQQYGKWLNGALEEYSRTGSGLKPEVLQALRDAKLKDPLMTPAAEAALDAASAPAISAAEVTGKLTSDRLGDFARPGKVFAGGATAAAATTAAADPFEELMASPAAAGAPPVVAGPTTSSPAAPPAPAPEADVLGSERLLAEVEATPATDPATGPEPVRPGAGTASAVSSPAESAGVTAAPPTEPAGWRPSPGIVAGDDLSLDEPASPDDGGSWQRPDDDPEPPPSTGTSADDDLGLP